MPVYNETNLPTFEELKVEEVNLSTPVMRAGGIHFGKYCEQQSLEFMLCRGELRDPRKCLEEGKAVTSCALEFFRKMKEHCKEEMHKYADCLDYSSKKYEYRYCRKTQALFDKCVLDNLDLERPPIGYFCRIKLHESKRPKPELDMPTFPDPTPKLPDDYPRKPALYNSRSHID